MTFIIIIDLVVVGALCTSTVLRGFERTLPLAAFLLILFPAESQIRVGGLFDLTTQRLIVIALTVLYVFFRKSGNDGTQKRRQISLKHLLIPLMVWMVISAANSVVFTVSLKTVLSQFFDYLVSYYIFSKSISNAGTVRKILSAFVAAMFVCSVFAAVEAYRNWSVISLFPAGPYRFSYLAGAVLDRGIRAHSTFPHAILFGATLAMAIPMALYLVAETKKISQKVFLWSAILLMFLDIYKTGSRGPWLALILSLGLLFILAKGVVRKYLTVISLLTITVLVVRPGVWDSITNLYQATEDSDTAQGQSYQWRYALYRIAFQRLNEDFGRALWGYGPESFNYLGWNGEFQGHIVWYDSCDSSIAALMIETGYVGLLIVAALLLKVAIVTFRAFRRIPGPANLLCIVLLANLLAFCFMMTNVLIWGWGQQNYMLWILIAIAMVYPELAPTEVTAREMAPFPVVSHQLRNHSNPRALTIKDDFDQKELVSPSSADRSKRPS